MFSALIVSMLALASVAGSGATQVVLELMARSAVEQDAGQRTRDALPEPADLFANGRDNALGAMAQQVAAPAGEEVEITVSLGVPAPRALAANEGLSRMRDNSLAARVAVYRGLNARIAEVVREG